MIPIINLRTLFSLSKITPILHLAAKIFGYLAKPFVFVSKNSSQTSQLFTINFEPQSTFHIDRGHSPLSLRAPTVVRGA